MQTLHREIWKNYLQEYYYERAQGFHEAKLKSGLFAKPQHSDGVSGAGEASSGGSADGPAPQSRHDVAFASEVFIAEWKEIVNYKSWNWKLQS